MSAVKIDLVIEDMDALVSQSRGGSHTIIDVGTLRRVRAAIRVLRNQNDVFLVMINEAGIGPECEEHPENYEGPCLCMQCLLA